MVVGAVAALMKRFVRSIFQFNMVAQEILKLRNLKILRYVVFDKCIGLLKKKKKVENFGKY